MKPKHDELRPPTIKSFGDLSLLMQILPGTGPDNLIGHKVCIKVKKV